MGATASKLYRIMASQASTAAPTKTVKGNQFPSTTTFTFARSSAGVFTLTASTATFTAGKTVVKIHAPLTGLQRIDYANTSTTVITFTSSVLNAGAADAADDIITNALIEIQVFE